MNNSPTINFENIYKQLNNDIKKYVPEEKIVNHKIKLENKYLINLKQKIVDFSYYKWNILIIVLSFIITIIISTKSPVFLCKEIKNDQGEVVKKLSLYKSFILFIFISFVLCFIFFYIKNKFILD